MGTECANAAAPEVASPQEATVGPVAPPAAAAALVTSKRHAEARPSNHYPPIEPPIDHIISHATANYPAVVPRRRQARAVAPRTLVPLEVHPLGPGRAQLAGEIEDANTLYVGQVLAGQPHGKGREYIKGFAALNDTGYFLSYEGEWLKGRKTGRGTMYSLSGETYTGLLLDGQRHGFGRMEFQRGDSYEGTWERGMRSGAGRLRSAASGDVFVGHFQQDKRHGPGTLYMVSRGKKYLAEYVAGEAKCGVWDDITSDELGTLTGNDAADMLSSLAASKRLLPALALDAPYEVLAICLQQLRQAPSRPSSAAGKGAGEPGGARGGSTGSLPPLESVELEALRLAAAWEVAGGGASRGGTVLCGEQLRRVQRRLLAVLGGPESEAPRALIEGLLAQGGGSGVTYDRLLAAACAAGNASWPAP